MRRPARPAPSALVAALLAAVLSVTALVLAAAPAGAHQPVFVEDSTEPHLAPILEDGTVSFAVYGTITAPGRVAKVLAHLRAGDPLSVELLIPALDPEQALAPGDLPRVTVVAPDGSARELVSAPGDRFDEPFSHTSYLRLAREEGAAVDGMYGFEVRADRPARFTLAIGQREVGGRVLNSRPVASDELARWYASPPPPPPATTVPPTTVTPPDDQVGAPAPAPREPAAPAADGSGAGWWLVLVVVLVAGAVAVLGVVDRRTRRRRPG